MYDYKENYSLNLVREDGEDWTSINVRFKADFLPDVLEKVREFLVAVGFTYVDQIVAVGEDGAEWSSEDR